MLSIPEDPERITGDPTEVSSDNSPAAPEARSMSTVAPSSPKKTFSEAEEKSPKQVVQDLLRDKITTHQNAFVSTGTNSVSQNEGYFAKRAEDGKKHILKHALKVHPIELPVPELVGEKPKAILQRKDPAEYKRLLTEYEAANRDRKKIMDQNKDIKLQQLARRDMVVEYITAKLYNRVLPKRSPKINLAESSEEGHIHLTSKFFEGFKTLTDLTGAKGNGAINSLDPSDSSKLHPELAKMRGFEKVIAGCLFAGEGDFHASNLGVVPSFNGDKATYEVVKIDHGRSGNTYPDEGSMRGSLADTIRACKYDTIPLNATELKEAISNMIHVSDKEIETMVTSSAGELKKRGVEVESMTPLGEDKSFSAMPPESRPLVLPELSSHKPETLSPMEKYFIDGFKHRREQLRKFVRNLEVIERIDGVSPEWKDGKWLQEIRDQDPIQWAKENGKTIEGKDPLIWQAKRDKHVCEEAARGQVVKKASSAAVAADIREAVSKTGAASKLSGEAIIVNNTHLQGKKEKRSR